MVADKSLEDLIADYELENELTSTYEYQLRYAKTKVEAWLGRSLMAGDLSDDLINKFLKDQQQTTSLSDRSRKNLRTSLLTIWRYAVSKNLASPPGKIRKVKVVDKNPEAWDFSQLQGVAKAAGQLRGKLSNGIPRNRYFPALIWFCFETGMRRGDALSFHMSWLKGNIVSFSQHKTSRVHACRLTHETVHELHWISERLHALKDENWETPLAFPQCITQLYYWMKQSRIKAGVDPNERNRSIQHLRRTGATAVESGSPHTAWKYLGHTTPSLSRKHYIDRRIADAPIIPPVNRSNAG